MVALIWILLYTLYVIDISIYRTDNAICYGTGMYGTVYRIPDTTYLYTLFEIDDIATVTVNYQQNRIKFYSDIKGL